MGEVRWTFSEIMFFFDLERSFGRVVGCIFELGVSNRFSLLMQIVKSMEFQANLGF